MSRERTLPSIMDAPSHNGIIRRCVVMTECAISTIKLPEGAFACIVASVPNANRPASIMLLDRDEVEAHIALLRNAMDDAERVDSGLAPMHSTPSLRRS